jgi:hypothetical protein
VVTGAKEQLAGEVRAAVEGLNDAFEGAEAGAKASVEGAINEVGAAVAEAQASLAASIESAGAELQALSTEFASATQAINQALAWYGVQLVANVLWPLLFFGARRIRLALVELLVRWTLIAGTALRFYRIRPLAGELLLPYFAWTSFAAVLNATIWRLNRHRAEGI